MSRIKHPQQAVQPMRIGCAGWNLNKDIAHEFVAEGTHLQRYASRFSAVEINSSFYRPHRPATYSKWAASVPTDFRFSVKVPKRITHELRLRDCSQELDEFLSQVICLGESLGCLLIQLPPSLTFDRSHARKFLQLLRTRFPGALVIEPRHTSWFEQRSLNLLEEFETDIVLADPPVNGAPAEWKIHRTWYRRLHGSPRMYYSSYSPDFLRDLANELQAQCQMGNDVWCVFDNTAAGAAQKNALELRTILQRDSTRG